MVINNEKMVSYLLPLILAFLLGFVSGCGLTIFLGENVPDHGDRAFQAGIGLGQKPCWRTGNRKNSQRGSKYS